MGVVGAENEVEDARGVQIGPFLEVGVKTADFSPIFEIPENNRALVAACKQPFTFFVKGQAGNLSAQ